MPSIPPRFSMNGPRYVRHEVTNFLKTYLPRHLADLRTEWRISVKDLPNPKRIASREIRSVDEWPTIAVVSGNQTTRRIEHATGGIGEYAVTYPIEIYSWVNMEGWDNAVDARDNYATAIKTLFLKYQTMERPSQTMLIAEQTMLEDFSDVRPVKGERYVAGSYCGFDLVSHEVVGLFRETPVNVVKTPVVEGYSVGATQGFTPRAAAHPALED